MVILAGQNVEKFNKNDKYRIFLIFLDFIFIDLLEWMVSKCQEKRQERTAGHTESDHLKAWCDHI